MPEVTAWRTRPVFICSTFRDMHAERDYLQDIVFPELAERLRERRHYLEPIDLRWGVETVSVDEEHEKELLVLTVCLDEVERSRPFFIALLGDRYGWIPPEERMAAAAQEKGLEGDVAGKSVTALEIEFGVLSRPEQQRRCFFYLRDPLPYNQMDPKTAALHSEVHGDHDDAEAAAQRLADLKSRLRRELPGRVRRCSAAWDAEEQDVTGLDAFGDQVPCDQRVSGEQNSPPKQVGQGLVRNSLAGQVATRSDVAIGRHPSARSAGDALDGCRRVCPG